MPSHLRAGLDAWGNDNNGPRAARLAWIRAGAAPARFGARARRSGAGGVTRFSYRVRDGNENANGRVESPGGYVRRRRA